MHVRASQCALMTHQGVHFVMCLSHLFFEYQVTLFCPILLACKTQTINNYRAQNNGWSMMGQM